MKLNPCVCKHFGWPSQRQRECIMSTEVLTKTYKDACVFVCMIESVHACALIRSKLSVFLDRDHQPHAASQCKDQYWQYRQRSNRSLTVCVCVFLILHYVKCKCSIVSPTDCGQHTHTRYHCSCVRPVFLPWTVCVCVFVCREVVWLHVNI